MKNLFLVLLAVCASSLAVAAQETRETIELNVNGVEVLATEAEVVKKLGNFSSRKRGGKVPCRLDKLIALRYPGLTLDLFKDWDGKLKVYTVTVTAPRWAVADIKAGATIDKVREKFGAGKLRKENGKEYLNYFIENGYAEFAFRKGRLTKIYWESNLCEE